MGTDGLWDNMTTLSGQITPPVAKEGILCRKLHKKFYPLLLIILSIVTIIVPSLRPSKTVLEKD